MQNQFSKQFESHIKFIYTFSDRIIVRGYIAKLFDTGQAIYLLRSLGFDRHTNGVFRLLTDQLNSHIASDFLRVWAKSSTWNKAENTAKQAKNSMTKKSA